MEKCKECSDANGRLMSVLASQPWEETRYELRCADEVECWANVTRTALCKGRLTIEEVVDRETVWVCLD